MDDQDISNFTINNIHFENLYNFAIRSKLRMIFDLNVLIRNPNNSWDNTNAKSIISFAKEKNMKLDWQLGNGTISFHNYALFTKFLIVFYYISFQNPILFIMYSIELLLQFNLQMIIIN